MTAVALLGQVTERIEIGTAVVPIQTRHPLIMAQQALTTQAVCGGRFTLGLGPSHHWIIEDQLGLAYDKPAKLVRDYLDVLTEAFQGPGRVDVDNDTYRVHSPVDVSDETVPVLLAALGPAMLKIAGERSGGTILWMADERAIGDYVVPALAAATDKVSRVVAGVPVALCAEDEIDEARATPAKCLGTRTSRPTTSGCSSTVTPRTSATPWPPETRPRSWPVSRATATPGSPTSPPGWCRWAATQKNAAEAESGRRLSFPRWHRASDQPVGWLGGIRAPRRNAASDQGRGRPPVARGGRLVRRRS